MERYRHFDAGALREYVELLAFQEEEPGRWGWVPVRTIHAQVELQHRAAVYSKLATSSRGVELRLRAQKDLNPDSALRWKGQHIHVTAVCPDGTGCVLVQGVLIEPVLCQGDVHHKDGPTFPGLLGERYLGHGLEAPYAMGTVEYILTTPKVIELRCGSLVRVGGLPYVVETAHVLGSHQNEYEITRRGEL